MAITIIKDNSVKPTEYPKQVTCQACQSVLNIGIDTDIKTISVNSLTDAVIYPGKGFNCPVCHKDNITG